MRRIVLVAAFVAGCGRVGFETNQATIDGSPIDGSPTHDVDGAIPPQDGATDIDGGMSPPDIDGGAPPELPAYVGKIGEASCGDTELTIIMARDVPVGRTLVATLAQVGIFGSGPRTVSDSGGNTWTLTTEVLPNGTPYVGMWSTVVTNALSSGSTITIVFPAGGSAFVVDELSGLAGVETFGTSESNNTSDFAATAVTSAASMLYCALGDYNNEPISTMSWTPTASFEAMCGGSSSNPGIRVGPVPMVGTGDLTCSGSYTRNNSWALIAAAYRAN